MYNLIFRVNAYFIYKIFRQRIIDNTVLDFGNTKDKQ